MLSDNTVKAYRRAIDRFLNTLTDNDIGYILSQIIPYIQTMKSDSSKKQFLSALKHMKNFGYALSEEDQAGINHKVEPLIMELSELLQKKTAENKATETEEEKLMDWDDIKLQFMNKYNTLNSFERLLTQLYIVLPPRRLEYATLQYLKNYPIEGVFGENRVYEYEDDEGEWYDFYLGDYKTAKTYGIYRFLEKKSSPLGKALTFYLTKRLVEAGVDMSALDNPIQINLFKMNQNTFGRKLTALCDKVLGKPINVNMLRHNFITTFLNSKPHPTLKMKNYFSKAMGHSVMTQQEYLKYAEED